MRHRRRQRSRVHRHPQRSAVANTQGNCYQEHAAEVVAPAGGASSRSHGTADRRQADACPGGGGNKPQFQAAGTDVGRRHIHGSGGAAAAQPPPWSQSLRPIRPCKRTSPAVVAYSRSDQAQTVPGNHGLPSGLRALSTVANARQVVAIDTHNTLFFSNDAGAHWNVITPPWQGRAVKVELVPTSYSSRYTQRCGRRGAGRHRRRRPHGGGTQGRPQRQGYRPDRRVYSKCIRGSHQFVDPGRPQNEDRSRWPLHRRPTRTGHTTRSTSKLPDLLPERVSGLTLNPAQQSQKDLTLAVGSLSQTVEVQGQAQPALAARKSTRRSRRRGLQSRRSSAFKLRLTRANTGPAPMAGRGSARA